MKAGDLARIMGQWHPDTEVNINVAPAIPGCETDYQWHDFTAESPSGWDEARNSQTFTILQVETEVIGC